MTIDVTITGVVFNAYGQRITGAQMVDNQFGYSLIQSGRATLATPGQFPQPMNTPFDASGGQVTLSANETIDSRNVNQYDGRTIVCTTALTISISEGINYTGGIIIPPAAGNVTITPLGKTQLNGAQVSLTRSLAANPVGFVITPFTTTVDSLLVGGA
jgi:hypothetical protein